MFADIWPLPSWSSGRSRRAASGGCFRPRSCPRPGGNRRHGHALDPGGRAVWSWHEPVPDNPGRLLLDLDYIVEWVSPTSPASTLDFWICPATLVFDPAWDLTADVDTRGWAFQLFLNAITRSGPDERGNSEWTLSGDRFTIEVGSPGFTQYLRRAPVLSDGHWLSVEERGGFSFARESYR